MDIKGINRIHSPNFYVIGKEGRGLAEESGSWVPLLWDQMNQHFEEIAGLINATDMSQLHLWGLMSDGDHWLEPWQKKDAIWQVFKYLLRLYRLLAGFAGRFRR